MSKIKTKTNRNISASTTNKSAKYRAVAGSTGRGHLRNANDLTLSANYCSKIQDDLDVLRDTVNCGDITSNGISNKLMAILERLECLYDKISAVRDVCEKCSGNCFAEIDLVDDLNAHTTKSYMKKFFLPPMKSPPHRGTSKSESSASNKRTP